MEVRIISCHKKGLWYENKIGRTFDVDLNNGKYTLCRNILFNIKCSDAEVIVAKPKRYNLSGNILSMLMNEPMTSIDIYHEYRNTISPTIKKSQILYSIYHLKDMNKIVNSGTKSRGKNYHNLSPLWKIK